MFDFWLEERKKEEREVHPDVKDDSSSQLKEELR
jgi:hypothetical protein